MEIKKVGNGFHLNSGETYNEDRVFEFSGNESHEQTLERALGEMRYLTETKIKDALKEFADV